MAIDGFNSTDYDELERLKRAELANRVVGTDIGLFVDGLPAIPQPIDTISGLSDEEIAADRAAIEASKASTAPRIAKQAVVGGQDPRSDPTAPAMTQNSSGNGGKSFKTAHELYKRDLVNKIKSSNMTEDQKEAILSNVYGMDATDLFTKHQSGTTGRNDPRINNMRDTTDDKLRQGLINSWNINRAYLGLSPVAQQPNFDKQERDDFRDWVLNKERMDIADKRADKVGGAKSPANVQLNSLIMQERSMENDLSDLVTGKDKYINQFMQNNRDLPNARQVAEGNWKKSYDDLNGRLSDVRKRKVAAGGTDYAAGTTQSVDTDVETAKKSDEARVSERQRKIDDKKREEEFKHEQHRDKLLQQADDKTIKLVNAYDDDPRVKSANQSSSFIDLAEAQIGILQDGKSTPEERALAADTLLKAYERHQNSGTVLLSEKAAIQQSFGYLSSMIGKWYESGLKGDSPISPNQVAAFQKNITKNREALNKGLNKAKSEFRTRAKVLRINDEIADEVWGPRALPPKAPEPPVTDGRTDSSGVMAPVPAPTRTQPKAAPAKTTPAPAPNKSQGKKWYSKATGQPIKPGTSQTVIDSLKAKGLIEER